MKRKLSAVEARKRLGEILEGVYYRGDEVVIERAGKPMAVVIPAGLYESLEKSRERVFELIERAQDRNKDVPYETIQEEVAAAVREARRDRLGQG
ncbi:MAG TPA: type II toxin-antitoxin system Phd/YefM family antitoxin [Dehalococcoidia bacterium]|nr:type II toxin-antitoxin system Phd/YefM family antitoxin [Dehalococcoidia bacterium]